MAETIDEITIDWKDENGQQLVRQLKKEVLTSGAWSTIMFLYQDFDQKSGRLGTQKDQNSPLPENGEESSFPSQNSISSQPSRQDRSLKTYKTGYPRWMIKVALKILTVTVMSNPEL